MIRNLTLPIAALCSLLAFWLWGTPPAASIVAQAQPVAEAPADERERWALDLLARLGNAQPTPATLAFVVAWTRAEDSCLHNCGYSSAADRNNMLNTTQEGFGATHAIDGDGVKNYPTYEQGMAATLQTLSYGYYTEIVAGLQTNDPERAYNGLINSPWAGSRYGGGAAFGQEWRGI